MFRSQIIKPELPGYEAPLQRPFEAGGLPLVLRSAAIAPEMDGIIDLTTILPSAAVLSSISSSAPLFKQRDQRLIVAKINSRHRVLCQHHQYPLDSRACLLTNKLSDQTALLFACNLLETFGSILTDHGFLYSPGKREADLRHRVTIARTCVESSLYHDHRLLSALLRSPL